MTLGNRMAWKVDQTHLPFRWKQELSHASGQEPQSEWQTLTRYCTTVRAEGEDLAWGARVTWEHKGDSLFTPYHSLNNAVCPCAHFQGEQRDERHGLYLAMIFFLLAVSETLFTSISSCWYSLVGGVCSVHSSWIINRPTFLLLHQYMPSL